MTIFLLSQFASLETRRNLADLERVLHDLTVVCGTISRAGLFGCVLSTLTATVKCQFNDSFSKVSEVKRNCISIWRSICQPEKSKAPVSETHSVICTALNRD